MTRVLWGIALGVLLLVGCAPASERCAWLDRDARYCLQPTHTTTPMDQRQRLDLRLGGEQHTLLADVWVDAEQQQLVLVTPLGQTVAQLVFDNQSARLQGPPLPWPTPLPPAALLAMVQIAWWPAAHVQAGLDRGWTLLDSPGLRTLRSPHGNADWLQIRYEPESGPTRRVTMRLPQRAMELDIEVLAP